MSTQIEGKIVDAGIIEANAQIAAPADAKSSWFDRSDALLERLGEFFNPIMVKECRQSLKNMQFVLSFFLTLLACWLWSMFKTADAYDQYTNTFNVRADEVLAGYLIILAFPLIIIVPYIAFRSLASERDDKTFELLAVTTLSPRQIVAGKLFSAFVQILLYFSAVLPCLAFSYMLQGIDFRTIAFCLFWLITSSVVYTLAALLFGTIAKERFWQILLSVAIIIGVCLSFMGACGIIIGLVHSFQRESLNRDFWPITISLAVNSASSGALFFFAAASQITFASDNRSTPLRICVLVQVGVFLASMAYSLWVQLSEVRAMVPMEGFLMLSVIASIYLYFAGLFAVSEPDKLSPRVKRGLPQSKLGVMLFTLLYPGPGRGYLFILAAYVATFAALVIGCSAFGLQNSNVRGRIGVTYDSFFTLGTYLLGYLMIYLGLGTLVMRFIQRRVVLVVMARVVFQLVLLMLGMFGPMLFMTLMGGSVNFDLPEIHLLNPFWGIIHTFDGKTSIINGLEWLVLAIGFCVFALNLPGIVSELRQSKMVLPERVQEEEKSKELPPVYVPQNPWDEPEVAS